MQKLYPLAFLFASPLSWLYFPLKVYGRENIPPQGGFILASNHLSHLDPVVLGMSVGWRPLNYMARDSLFKNKIFKWIITDLGAFPIKRDSADIGALKEAIRRLKVGMPLVLFPEGTRKVEQKETQAGVGFIAVKSGVPVVPAFIEGSNQVITPGRKGVKRHRVNVFLGKPQNYSKEKSYEAIAEDIMFQINNLPSVYKKN